MNALQTASPPQELTVFNPLYNRSTTDTDGYVYPDARLEPIINSLVSADTIALNTGRALPELPVPLVVRTQVLTLKLRVRLCCTNPLML